MWCYFSGVFLSSIFNFGGQLLLEFRNPLALLPVAILRSVPMNLLAIPAAVAVRFAFLTELAIGAVQWGAANLTALSTVT